MDSAFLARLAQLIDARGVTVHRFEFPYMAARTAGLSRRPAPRAEALVADYRAALSAVRETIGLRARLFAGGKSMGGRIACLAVNEDATVAAVTGVVVLGFPLAPRGNPKARRSGVLERLARPSLIVQGTRDPFGGRAAFAALRLPAGVDVYWIEDGDHDLRPRKASGTTHEAALMAAADAIVRFCRRHD